jgi:hypothetical protein
MCIIIITIIALLSHCAPTLAQEIVGFDLYMDEFVTEEGHDGLLVSEVAQNDTSLVFAISGSLSGLPGLFSSSSGGSFIAGTTPQIVGNGMLDLSSGATAIVLNFTSDGSGVESGILISKAIFYTDTGSKYEVDIQFDARNYTSNANISQTVEFTGLALGTVTSSTHRDGNLWYSENVVSFGWDAVPGADYYLWDIVPNGQQPDPKSNGVITTELSANTVQLNDGQYVIEVMAFAQNAYQSLGRITVSIDTETSLPIGMWFGEFWGSDLNQFPRYVLDQTEGTAKYYTNKTDSIYVWLENDVESELSGFNRAYVSVSSSPSDRPVFSQETELLLPATEVLESTYNCAAGGPYVENGERDLFSFGHPLSSTWDPRRMRFSYQMESSQSYSGRGLWGFASRADLPGGLTDYYLGDSSRMGGKFAYFSSGTGTSPWVTTDSLFVIMSATSSGASSNICVTSVESEFNTKGLHRTLLSGLSPGRNYIHVAVRDNAFNFSDNGYWIIDVDPEPPLAVTSMSAREYSDGDVLLSWSASSDDRSGLAKYKIYRSTRADLLGALIDSTTALQYRDRSRANGGSLVSELEYFYTVRAVDAVGNENTSNNNIQVGSKTSLPLPDATSIQFSTGGRVSAGINLELSVSGSFPFDGGLLTFGEPTVNGSQIVLNVSTQWIEDTGNVEWSFSAPLQGLSEGSYSVQLVANGESILAEHELEIVGLPGVVLGSISTSTEPSPAIISETVSLRINGQLPSTDASIAQATIVSQSGSLIVLNMATQWDGDTGNMEVTPFETEVAIGYLHLGNYSIQLQVDGEVVETSSIEVLEGPPPEGPILIDFNTDSGDQSQRVAKGAIAGREYTLQLNATDLATAINGWNITVSYDPDKLEYVVGSFQVGSFISGLIGLEDISKLDQGLVSIGGTTLGSEASGEGAGTIGEVKFRVAEDFSGQAEVQVVEVSLRPVDGDQIKIEVQHTVSISDETELLGDNDGDGAVGFSDFFIFADNFGSANPAYDYDGSGTVDFGDFFIFADNFGKEGQAKLIAIAQEMIGLPEQSGLLPNYPNPFNMTTTIPFQIMLEGEYSVAIYNTTGQLVRTMHSGFVPFGLHQLLWDGLDDQGRSVSTGLYLVALRGMAINDIRKITLLK